MSLNTNSNTYITVFLISMVVVVAFLLSFVATGLKPIISKNEEVDKKKKILKSVITLPESEEKEVFTPEFVLQEYSTKISENVVNYQGETIDGASAFEIDIKKEFRKPIEERRMPVFIYNEESGDQYYIVPLIGMGLWDEISGYIALEEDMSTIKGAAFDHKAETPGLGAEISKSKFTERFIGEEIFDDQGDYSFLIMKGTGNELADKSEYRIDGLSGATLTIDGVNAMMNKILVDYRTYFDKVKTKG